MRLAPGGKKPLSSKMKKIQALAKICSIQTRKAKLEIEESENWNFSKSSISSRPLYDRISSFNKKDWAILESCSFHQKR